MSNRTRFWCDACGAESSANRLRPIFTMVLADSFGGASMWEKYMGDAIAPQYKPSKLGDACAPCLQRICSQLQKAPNPELDGPTLERLLSGVELGDS